MTAIVPSPPNLEQISLLTRDGLLLSFCPCPHKLEDVACQQGGCFAWLIAMPALYMSLCPFLDV